MVDLIGAIPIVACSRSAQASIGRRHQMYSMSCVSQSSTMCRRMSSTRTMPRHPLPSASSIMSAVQSRPSKQGVLVEMDDAVGSNQRAVDDDDRSCLGELEPIATQQGLGIRSDLERPFADDRVVAQIDHGPLETDVMARPRLENCIAQD